MKNPSEITVRQPGYCRIFIIMKKQVSQVKFDGNPGEIFISMKISAAMVAQVKSDGRPAAEDTKRFLDAMIYNWVIGGTDAHLKIYGFLLAAGSQVRLGLLYDLSSCLPYRREIPPQKAKLAMKIGGSHQLSRIGPGAWERTAQEWKLDGDEVADRILQMVKTVPNVMSVLDREGGIMERLGDELIERVSTIRKMFDS